MAPLDACAGERRGNRGVRRVTRALGDTMRAYAYWLAAEAESAGRAIAPAPREARHALIVASVVPPAFAAGAFRPLSWLKYGGDNGWRVSALTSALAEAPSEAGVQLAATLPDSVNVHRATPLRLAPSHRLFAQIDGGLTSALGLVAAGVDAVSANPPSVVVGTGPNFNTFVAALHLARRFGSRLVLDYRDEWTECPFRFVELGNADRWWERRCLRAADAVLFTTESQLRHARAVFGRLIGDKGRILPNGWEPDPSVEAAACSVGLEGSLAIAFSGVLAEHCLPGAFLRDCAGAFAHDAALRDLVRLHFIGRRTELAEAELNTFPYPDRLVFHDMLPKSDADAMIRAADALLLIARPDLARYIPGKLYDYVASKRPILVHGHPGEATNIVTNLNAGVFVADGRVDDMMAALRRLAALPADDWNSARRTAWIDTRTRARLTGDFFDILTSCVAGEAEGAP